MFADGRSGRVLFVAHCLLNQNAISDNTAVYRAAFREVAEWCLAQEVGMVQMPCPELCCLGLDRGDPEGGKREVTVENTRIRQAMQESGPDEMLKRLVEHVMLQITQYRKHGIQILGIVGANRSPSCGVETTSDHNREQAGRGLFMEKLEWELGAKGMELPMIGIKASDDVEEKLNMLKSRESGQRG